MNGLQCQDALGKPSHFYKNYMHFQKLEVGDLRRPNETYWRRKSLALKRVQRPVALASGFDLWLWPPALASGFSLSFQLWPQDSASGGQNHSWC